MDTSAMEADASASGNSLGLRSNDLIKKELSKKKKKRSTEMSFDIEDYELDDAALGFSTPYMFDATQGEPRFHS